MNRFEFDMFYHPKQYVQILHILHIHLTLLNQRCSLNAQKNSNKFGFSLDLINFLTLRNENLFSFPSLNRNFALSLQRLNARRYGNNNVKVETGKQVE